MKKIKYFILLDKAKKLGTGKMTIQDYILHSKTSLDELIKFAKQQRLSADIIRNLNKLTKPYTIYTTPFNKKKYLESTILSIDGKEVIPTSEDVNKCIDYLKSTGEIICDLNVRKTILDYKKGTLVIEENNEDDILTEEDKLDIASFIQDLVSNDSKSNNNRKM